MRQQWHAQWTRSTPTYKNLSATIKLEGFMTLRMVNDILAVLVLPYCQLPHADIKWLIDTLDCSEGLIVAHMMDTVVHELGLYFRMCRRPNCRVSLICPLGRLMRRGRSAAAVFGRCSRVDPDIVLRACAVR